MMVKRANDGLLQANDGNMLFNDWHVSCAVEKVNSSYSKNGVKLKATLCPWKIFKSNNIIIKKTQIGLWKKI